MLSATMFSVNYHTSHRRYRLTAGFTMVEAVVAIAVLGIGVAATLGALTKVNAIASASRNATGAQTIVQNQIDLLVSDSPFNPQKTNLDGSVQIPPELTLGTHTTSNVAIYKEPTTGVIVSGTLTWVVTDVTGTYNSNSIPMYNCTVTVTYTYLNKNYSTTMTTLRVCDV
jgi:type II secretory pathway pseudopilin PulG